MSKQEKGIESQSPNLVLSSEGLPYGELVSKTIEINGRKIGIEALLRKGTSYFGEKKASEDAGVILSDHDSLQVIVVDGGTQVKKVDSFDALGLSGGRYIAVQVEQIGKKLNPSRSAASNLREINTKIGEDVKANHPEIRYGEDSDNAPYGSIASIKIDTKNQTLEVANAGDVYVVSVDSDGKPTMLSVDDVYKQDQKAFSIAKKLAGEHNVTFRYAMQHRKDEERFFSIQEEMLETMRQGNVGIIRRVSGAPDFDVTSSVIIPLKTIMPPKEIRSIYLFTDGGNPPGFSVSTPDGLAEFKRIIESGGLNALNEDVVEKLSADVDYENYPRFGGVDDLMIVKITLQ